MTQVDFPVIIMQAKKSPEAAVRLRGSQSGPYIFFTLLVKQDSPSSGYS